MGWQFENGTPIYMQIVRELEVRIVRGVYPPGEKFPSVRELAFEAGVNPNTLQRALQELEREELLFTQRTSGRFVTQDQQRIDNLRQDLAIACIRELLEKLSSLGLTEEEARSLLHKAKMSKDEEIVQEQTE